MFVEVQQREYFELRWATPLIVCICLGVAFYEVSLNNQARLGFLSEYGTVPKELLNQPIGALLTRLFGALFLHVDAWHLVGNLLFLLLFGLAVERVFRSRWCLFTFLLCGALANFVTGLAFPEVGAPLVGSSGAVSGLIGAYVILFPRAKLGLVLPLGIYFQFVRVPAQHLIGLWLFLQVLYTIASPTLSEVAWVSHVTGFVAGFALATVLRPVILRKPKHRRLMR
jgi:membrane associated rhomboid family serine protease